MEFWCKTDGTDHWHLRLHRTTLRRRQTPNAGYAVRGTGRSLQRSAEVSASLSHHAEVSRLSFAQADLGSDDGWDAAVAGCVDALHVASPFPANSLATSRN